MGTYVHVIGGGGGGGSSPIPHPIANNLVAMDAFGNLIDSGVAPTTDYTVNNNTHLPTSAAMQAAILAAVTAGFTFQGIYDASSNTFPALNDVGGPITKGDFWVITVGGTFPGGEVVYPNDTVMSLIDVPGQNPANWTVNSMAVRSVFGRIGDILAQAGDYDLSQITGALDALALKADLDSPALTGTPTAPTPLASDSSTTIATTASILNKDLTGLSADVGRISATDSILDAFGKLSNAPTVTALVISSNGDTILMGTLPNRVSFDISAASGDNTVTFPGGGVTSTTILPSTAPTNQFATGISSVGVISYAQPAFTDISGTASIAQGGTGQTTASAALVALGAAPLASPALTGTPTAPTASPGTNSTQIATTAFVAASAAAGVTSFNTRTGAVVPSVGDYTYAQVTGAAPLASPALTGMPTAPTQTQGDNSTHIATTAYTDVALASKANLASPALTGTPTAPTQTQADNSTKLATTAYVDTGLAPKADTTTVNTALALKAPLASPALTGTPTVPTAAPGTNTTQAASTAFVQTAVGSAGVTSFNTRVGAVVSASGDYTYAQVTGKANLASPALTGTPTAPTASPGDNSTKLATTAYADTALALKAPLASPALTGNPTAPTQSQGDNSTKLATTAYTDVGLALKANLASPALTGTPTAPTAITSTNTTQIATTAFVQAKVAATTNVISSATNTMTSVVNSVSSNAPIVNSSALAIASTSLTSTVNGVASAAVSVTPGGQSITSSITFTTLNEQILLVAPSINAVGFYTLQLKDANNNELDIMFSISGNVNSKFNQSTINILEINDSLGIITDTNFSNYLLLRGYVRTDTPNSYFAVTISLVKNIPYTNPVSMTVVQSGLSYLNENATITAMITTDISNLVSTAAANLIFKMKVNYVPVTASIPQGYVYAPAGGTGAIYQNSVNPATGALTALSPASFTTTTPYIIAATKSRNYAYGTVATGTNIYQFAIDPTTGVFSALSPSTITGPNTATGVSIDPTNRFVYFGGYGAGVIGQFSITKSTGQLVAIASAPTAAGGIQDVSVHPSGKWLYASNFLDNKMYMYAIDQTTGALTALSTPTFIGNTAPIWIAMHPSGKWLYTTNTGTFLTSFVINTTTGILTASSSAGISAAANTMAIHPNGLFIYYSMPTLNEIQQASIDQSTGHVIGPVTTLTVAGAKACCFDYSGTYLYVVSDTNNTINVFTINPVTGAMTAGGTIAVGTNCRNLISI